MNLSNLNPFGSIYGIMGSLIALAIILIVIYFMIKNGKKGEGEKKEIDTVTSDIEDLQKAGVRATLKPSKITALANTISDALSKAGRNKTEAFAAVYAAISFIKNEVDLLALKKAYGIREIYNGFGNPKDNPKLTLNESVQMFTPNGIALINQRLIKNGFKTIAF